MVIDCKKLSESILNECIKQKRNKNLSLLIISVGSDPASESYVRGKKKDCEKCGIDCYHFSFPLTIAPGAFYSAVSKLANDSLYSGVIIQLPLPKSIDTRVALNLIPPKKDIDGLTSFNAGGIYLNHPSFFPCTPLGVVKIIESLNLDSEKYKDVVIIGRSDLVGKPLALMLTHMNYTVTLCHSKTKNLPQKTKNADIVIDKYHIVTQVYNALNSTRVSLCKKDNPNYKKLKDLWKLIVKNENDLSEEKKYSNNFHKYMSQKDMVNFMINTDKNFKSHLWMLSRYY